MNQLWLYLYFPHLQLDSLLAQSDASHAQPTVVLDGSQNLVAQVNQKAIEAGIRINMNLGTAAALSHDLQVIAYDSEIESERLLDITEQLYLITADICLHKPNSLLLRVHNMLHLYGDLNTYWHTLKQVLDRLKFTYQFATAHSPLAAKLLAFNKLNRMTNKTEYLEQQLAQSSLQYTELDVKTQHKLNRVGVHTLGDLLPIPLADIAKRFDLDLVNYLGRLSGEFKHTVRFFQPEVQFERYLELLYDIENSQNLLGPLKYLLKRLEQFLLIRDHITFSLIIHLYQREHPILVIEIGAQQGEYLARKWLALLSLKLESVQVQSPVYGIKLSTGATQIHQPDEPDLFSPKQSALSRLQLSAVLQAKLGQDVLHGVNIKDDFRPQCTIHYSAPFSDTISPSLLQANRPVLLLESIKPLQEQVSIIQGPERIQTGWWDNQEIHRDYFIARTEQGIWYWVFRTPAMKWYLHGIFS